MTREQFEANASARERHLEKIRAVGRAVGEALGIGTDSLTRWYEVTPLDVIRHGGLSIHWRYRYSIPLLAKTTYPDHPWEPSRFKAQPHGQAQSDPAYLRAALLYIAERAGMDGNNMDNWYKSHTEAQKEKGVLWIPDWMGSRILFLRAAFPDHTWDPKKLLHKDKGHWKSKENTRKVIEELGEKLGIKKGDYEVWYNVHGLSTLIPRVAKVTSESRYKFFSSIFPEHNWNPHLFKSTGVDVFTASTEVLIRLVKDLEKLLEYQTPEDWYKATKSELERLGFRRDLPTQAYLLQMLQVAYPSIDWDPGRLRFPSNGFGSLFSNIVKLFGTSNNSKGASVLRKPNVKQALLVPGFDLLFDYQGPQFYVKQVLEKREMVQMEPRPSLVKWCEDNRYTLITIPFWFDRDKKYLLAEIWNSRPDLFTSSGPLQSYANLASSTSREPAAVPRSSLTLNRNYITAWKLDSRFESIAVPIAQERRGRKPRKAPSVAKIEE